VQQVEVADDEGCLQGTQQPPREGRRSGDDHERIGRQREQSREACRQDRNGPQVASPSWDSFRPTEASSAGRSTSAAAENNESSWNGVSTYTVTSWWPCCGPDRKRLRRTGFAR
jgi:hypothetical protein